jgi:hypothetical protein
MSDGLPLVTHYLSNIVRFSPTFSAHHINGYFVNTWNIKNACLKLNYTYTRSYISTMEPVYSRTIEGYDMNQLEGVK